MQLLHCFLKNLLQDDKEHAFDSCNFTEDV